jgi:hypothetical protein
LPPLSAAPPHPAPPSGSAPSVQPPPALAAPPHPAPPSGAAPSVQPPPARAASPHPAPPSGAAPSVQPPPALAAPPHPAPPSVVVPSVEPPPARGGKVGKARRTAATEPATHTSAGSLERDLLVTAGVGTERQPRQARSSQAQASVLPSQPTQLETASAVEQSEASQSRTQTRSRVSASINSGTGSAAAQSNTVSKRTTPVLSTSLTTQPSRGAKASALARASGGN